MEHLSLIQQNYIETIHHLCEVHGHAHTKDIAEMLNIKMASASEAMRTLSSAGYVNYSKRRAITLTEKGCLVAAELQKKHVVLAEFFRLIGCGNEESEETACRVEHHISGHIAALMDRHIEEICEIRRKAEKK